jgi:hypothetical protein
VGLRTSQPENKSLCEKKRDIPYGRVDVGAVENNNAYQSITLYFSRLSAFDSPFLIGYRNPEYQSS